jgi:hypothetical protein
MRRVGVCYVDLTQAGLVNDSLLSMLLSQSSVSIYSPFEIPHSDLVLSAQRLILKSDPILCTMYRYYILN